MFWGSLLKSVLLFDVSIKWWYIIWDCWNSASKWGSFFWLLLSFFFGCNGDFEWSYLTFSVAQNEAYLIWIIWFGVRNLISELNAWFLLIFTWIHDFSCHSAEQFCPVCIHLSTQIHLKLSLIVTTLNCGLIF